MTMTNAEWMIKNGYKFSELRWSFTHPDICRFYLNDKNVGKVSSLSIFEATKTWLDMEHEETEAIKHAHWVDMRLDDVHVCSHCDNVVLFMNGNEPNYCPYCGARMDAKDETD